MTLTSDGMKTTVIVHAFEKSKVDEHIYSQTGETIVVSSVDGYEESLVEIKTHNGSVIVRGDQLVLAVKKCNIN